MKRTFGFVTVLTVITVLGLGEARGQTPGQVPVFDQAGTGACNNANGNDCIDSVITQDASGNIGIGTTAPVAKLHVSNGNLNLENSTATSGNILKGGSPFMHNFGPANIFVGAGAGNFMVTGDDNVGIGSNALDNVSSGFSNTAVGGNALRFDTSGDTNTAIGRDALISNTQGSLNTAVGRSAMLGNTTGSANTVMGVSALQSSNGSGNTAVGELALDNNSTGSYNAAIGMLTLSSNGTGYYNTGIGALADVSAPNLLNATAIGYGAVVNASNKIRLGNTTVTVIEGQVPYSFTSDRNQKENFRPVDGEQVLRKIGGLSLTSWKYIGHDAQQFRHYGPVAQEFFAAFGHDGVGTIGTDKTINSGDMEGILMIAVQALSKENAELKARLEALERLAEEANRRK